MISYSFVLNLWVALGSTDGYWGGVYIGDAEVSLNEQMITEGYAWEYDGGTKQKNFEELREIRRANGTLTESKLMESIITFQYQRKHKK